MILSSISSNFYKYKRKLTFIRTFSTKINKNDLKVLFFGTDNFSLPSLKVLHKHNNSKIENLAVVTSFKSPANCVRQYAEQQKLRLYKWPIVAEDCHAYDLGVVVSFGHMIPSQIIEAFPLGMINVHASLLPRWRGAAPIIYAIMNGDKETGVSIMRIEPKRFDIGDIFAKKSVTIKPDVYMPELHKELAEEGANLLLEVVKGCPQTLENPLKQNEQEATYAPKITPAITEIDWPNMTAQDIYNRHRALYTFKALTCRFQTKSIEILEVKLPPATVKSTFSISSPPGSVEYRRERKCLQVKCAKETFVEIFRLRVEGKKAMNAIDFNNGFLKKLSKSEMEFYCNKTAVSC
ncbi:hypothetical protein FF38_11658 [Lucilia cuprina]|uniref:Methionyl-tRNA formyltransferase, mitochondrial n=1 Tax=Lucilia cuprina TaxID=7375 RepID=A0A0L0CEM2_LUCCU|nr:mitochondrial, Methionyl-tRNA formyltransferase [Lucilia cuprina]KNC30701.1 hypothetical protein FF38_11658 [Lucilia cuprina]